MAYKPLFSESEDSLIPVPEGFHRTSNAGGFFSYDKVLKNGHVQALSGPHGNKEMQVVSPEQDNSDYLNAAFVYSNEEKDGEPLEMHFFRTKEELNDILRVWENQPAEGPMEESYKPLFKEDTSRNVDEILKHYLMAALWSTLHNDDEYLDHYYSIDDVSGEAKQKAKSDVEKFLAEAGPYIGDKASDEQIGHDFLLTRNDHGAGFWDRGDLYLDGDRLTEIAKTFGEINFYAEHNVVES